MPDDGVSSLLDALFVILIVTVAIAGTWFFTMTGWSRHDTQERDYNLDYTSVALNRFLQSTLPEVELTDPGSNRVSLTDQKVIELLSFEMIFIRHGVPANEFDELENELRGMLEGMMVPNHKYAIVAIDSTPLLGEGDESNCAGAFFFVMSESHEIAGSWEDVIAGKEVFTASYDYVVPSGIARRERGESLHLTVNLACWVDPG